MAIIDTINYESLSKSSLKMKVLKWKDFHILGKERPHIYAPHRLDFYGIMVFTAGNGKHQIDQREIEVAAGDIIILGPGQVHAFLQVKNLDGYIISISEDFFVANQEGLKYNENHEILEKAIAAMHLHMPNDYQEISNHLLESLLIEFNKSMNLINLKLIFHLISSLLQVLNSILKDGAVNMVDYSDRDRILAYSFRSLLIENVRTKRQLSFYLDQLIISQSRLQQATKKTFGKSPKELLDETLILHIKKQLADPCKRIQEIAYDLGFSEPTNFIKFFKKHTGQTPESYRSVHYVKFVN